jgi:pilus assembly protein Flp/PilA
MAQARFEWEAGATAHICTEVDDFINSSAKASRVEFDKEQSMTSIMTNIRRFLVSEDGPTAVEYAVMLGLIVVAIVAVVGNLATSISGTFSTVSSTLGS